MAQLSSAQREPSMEEILASIRRIIEDSDGGRKPADALGPLQSGLASALHEISSSEPSDQRGSAEVIEVETFRGGLQDESRIAAPAKRISLAEVQAQLAAERGLQEASDPETAAPVDTVVSHPSLAETPGISEWRLGVAEEKPEFVAAEPEFDVEEVASAVLQDVTASGMDGGEDDQGGTNEPGVSPEPVRLSLISDRAGRQVAASFNELSEALAARSRRSMEEMAEEMLRPMLQDWLDNNLPTLVERLVREEIERVARGT